jgi:hypothetical protein
VEGVPEEAVLEDEDQRPAHTRARCHSSLQLVPLIGNLHVK